MDYSEVATAIQKGVTEMNPFGNSWWGPAKWTFIITVSLKLILLIFRLFGKGNLKLYSIIGIIVGILFNFYLTLTATCLYNGGCSILAGFSLVFPVIILLVLMGSVFYELKSVEDGSDEKNDDEQDFAEDDQDFADNYNGDFDEDFSNY